MGLGMWGYGLLVTVFIVLAIFALIKYLRD